MSNIKKYNYYKLIIAFFEAVTKHSFEYKKTPKRRKPKNIQFFIGLLMIFTGLIIKQSKKNSYKPSHGKLKRIHK